MNALAAAMLLIVLAVSTRPSLRVTPEMVVEATKNTSPETGLELLSRGIEKTQRRAAILTRYCYASLALLIGNAIFWATWRAAQRPTNQPLERTGPAT